MGGYFHLALMSWSTTLAGSPLIVFPTATSNIVLEAVKVQPRKGGACRKVDAMANLESCCAHRRERSPNVTKKRTFRSNKETHEEKKMRRPRLLLTKKAPYKGLSADSEEKHEPVSGIDAAAVDAESA